MDLKFAYMPATYDETSSMDDTSATIVHFKDDPSVKLTIRLIMQGKEVGSIIGKKGEIVKRFREESGAIINISDGSCPERIVTVSGSTNAIYKAFSLITKKFEEWCSQFNENGTANAGGGGGGGGGKSQIQIRLIVPASQCGSLIGKGGSKIKEIRESTGCSIQVASEMLPNSTERAVTLSGTAEQITQCIYHICCVMLESPPKGATIPYRPKPQVNGPVIVANGQAYTIQGNYAVPTQETCTVFPLALAGGHHHHLAGISGLADPMMKGAHLQAAMPPHHLQHHIHDMSGMTKNPLAGLAALGLAGMAPTTQSGINPTALAALAGSQLRTSNQTRTAPQTNQQQQEMTVPNDLIGCIIGKGGTKIAEIRQISGAMIRISNCEEREGGNTDRTITISGNPDSVALAQYLINMSVELQKANLQETNNQTCTPTTTGGAQTATPATTLNATASASNNPLASAIPLAQLLTKPGALNALSSLQALGGLSDLLGGLVSMGNASSATVATTNGSTNSAGNGAPIQTTGVHRTKAYTPRIRSPNTNTSSERKSDRNKFNPISMETAGLPIPGYHYIAPNHIVKAPIH